MTIQLFAAADAVCNAILNAVTDEREDVVVESPPGAGKTRLIEDATAHASLVLRRRVIVACPSNDQADDATRRIGNAFPQLQVDRFIAADAERPKPLHRLKNVAVISDRRDLSAPVTVATIAKYTEIASLGFQADYLYIDEAFQVRKSEYERIRGLARQTMLIGDPWADPAYRQNLDPPLRCGPQRAAHCCPKRSACS